SGIGWWLAPSFWRQLAAIEIQWLFGLTGGALALAGLAFARPVPLQRLLRCWAATLLVYYLLVARMSGSADAGSHYHVYGAPLWALAIAAALQRGLDLAAAGGSWIR